MQGEPGRLEMALDAARQGELGAYNTLVEAFQRQVFNVCYRTLGNSEDAADVTQETFLSAFRSLKTFNGSATGLRGWLLRIAVNACYDQLRRRQRRPTDSLDAVVPVDAEHAAPSVAERLADPAPDPEQRSLSAESARVIQQAIDSLPPDQRMTVILCDVQDMSYEEAAQIMSVELGTVKSRLSRARAQLRAILAEKGELPGRSARLQERNS